MKFHTRQFSYIAPSRPRMFKHLPCSRAVTMIDTTWGSAEGFVEFVTALPPASGLLLAVTEDGDTPVMDVVGERLVHWAQAGEVVLLVSYSEATMEYIVRAFVEGEHQAEADYFTDSLTDALATAAAMVKSYT